MISGGGPSPPPKVSASLLPATIAGVNGKIPLHFSQITVKLLL